MQPDLEHSTLVADRLRELPVELAPPLAWDEFRLHLQDLPAQPNRTTARQAWRYAALAAGVATLVAGLAIWSRMNPQANELELAGHVQAELPDLSLPDFRIIKQAEASERWLASLPTEPVVMRVGTRGAVADLEDRIALMDDVLSEEALDAVSPTHIVALQHERARLVNSLAQVRYAETLAAAVP
jgi:hypothetical protein